MRTFLILLISSATALSVWPDIARSEGPPTAPTVVLQGEGDKEVAPHGEGNVYAPDILRDGERLRMWYGGQGKDGHDRISHAESADGIKWDRKGVVLDVDGLNHVNDPSVVKVGSRYFLYYSRTADDVVDRIDVAVSDDGDRWEPMGLAVGPGPAGAWDGLSVGRPSVLHEDGLFRMWYDGRKDFSPGSPVKGVPTSDTSHRSVGYATSKDGLTWVKSGQGPVYEHDAGGVDVKRVGGRLVMLYESREGTRFATGKDGLDWREGGILAGKSGAKVDAFGHVTPFLLLDPDGGRPRLFFGTAGRRSWDGNRIAVLELGEEALDRLAR